MGIETIALVAGGLQVAQGVAGYVQQKKADSAARRAANAEAAIMEQDAQRAALQEKIEADKVRQQQRVAFLTSGVDLSGSPLLLMEETRNKGNENAKNVTDSASARASLVRQQGSVKRASLIGSAINTGANVANTYMNYKTVNRQIS